MKYYTSRNGYGTESDGSTYPNFKHIPGVPGSLMSGVEEEIVRDPLNPLVEEGVRDWLA